MLRNRGPTGVWVRASLLVSFAFCTPNNPPQDLLDVPVVQEELCPFELGCPFGEWTALESIPAYLIRGDTASRTILLAEGETFRAIRGDMITSRFGRVAVLDTVHGYGPRNSLEVEHLPGDTLLVASYAGEGIYALWSEDGIYFEERFWGDTISGSSWSSGSFRAQLIRPTLEVWWVRVATDDGIGWLRYPNQRVCGVRVPIWGDMPPCSLLNRR